jgi:Mg-chelatase subunit ChlD
MAFLNPLFLIGAVAAAIPVLVHLVRRTRARRVEFASLMFLRRIEQKTIRKRKLRNLLLLAMRCAALLLLALAFARPYFTFQKPVSASSSQTNSVILIDASYSMRYGGAFDRAKQTARNIVDEAGADGQVAVALFSQTTDVLMPLKADPAQATASVNQAEPGLGATDYLQAIQAADSILKDAGAGGRRIHLISDFQDAGWNRAAPPLKLAPDVKLIPVDVSETGAANLAISEIKAEPVIYSQKYSAKLAARVSNFSTAAASTVVDLKLNDLTVERREVKLDPGSSQMVEFTGFNVLEGVNRATVEITGDDFTLDNRRFFTIKREDQARVLAVETATRGRSESFFLQQALVAGETSQHAIALKSAGAVSPAEIDSFRTVVINDVSGISDQLATALKDYVARGGGLILVAARHTDANEFNRVFAGLAPAKLTDLNQGRAYNLMSQVRTDHPIFSQFARSGRLASTRVYGYYRSVPNETATTIAALDDGTPLIVEGSSGAGKVLLITTTLDTAWNDLPLTPMYLPLVRQMLEYLGGSPAGSSVAVGQVFTVKPDTDGSFPLIESPSGQRIDDARKTPTGEQSVDAREQGFYRLRYRDRAEYVAVNLDQRESDFTRLNVDEFIASVTPGADDKIARPDESLADTPADVEARQRVWLVLLLLALALFIAEALMARRIRIAKLVG